MGMPEFSFTSRVRPVVEVGLGSAQVPTGSGLWDDARWDDPTALWTGDEPMWRDITCEVQAVDGDLGRARITDPFPQGTCTLLIDNASGWADPDVEVPGVLTMRPGRPIRVGVDHIQFGRRWLFRGFIDQILPEYDPEQPDWVGLVCIDAFGEAGRAKLSATVATGANETADQRVARILNAVPWLASKRVIEPTSIELVAGVLDGVVADMLRRCADSAGGACFGDGDGNVVFRARDWLFHTSDSPLDGTIGNSSTTLESPGMVEFPGETTSRLTVSSGISSAVGSQVTLIAQIRPDSLTGANQVPIWFEGAGGWVLTIMPSGQLQWLWWRTPSTFAWTYSQTLVGAPIGADGWLWIGVEFNASGSVRFYASPDGRDWLPVGQRSFAATTIQAAAGPLHIGGRADFLVNWLYRGDIGRVVIRNGVDGELTGGSVVFDFNPTADITNPAATSITTTSGHTMDVETSGASPNVLVPSVSEDVPDVCPTGWRRPFARSDLATRVILDRRLPPGDPPATPRTYNDSPSQILYGVEPFERLDLWTRDDADLDILGQRILAQRSATTMPIVDGVSLDTAAGDRDAQDRTIDLLSLLSIWKPSRYRCRLELSRGVVFDRPYFATGIRFHMDRDSWTADVSLDWSELYEIPATSARWDQSRWDRARWT